MFFLLFQFLATITGLQLWNNKFSSLRYYTKRSFNLVIFEEKFLLIGTRHEVEIFSIILSYISQQLEKFLSNSQMDHVQVCITWSFRYNNYICFRIQQSERMAFGPGSDYPHFEKWKLSLVQYSLKYARSNANWCKGLRVSWCLLYFLLHYGIIWLRTTYILPKWLYGEKKGYSKSD